VIHQACDGRYLAGVGIITPHERSWVVKHGGEILRRCASNRKYRQARAAGAWLYEGHGPVEGWERDGLDLRNGDRYRQVCGYRWYAT